MIKYSCGNLTKSYFTDIDITFTDNFKRQPKFAKKDRDRDFKKLCMNVTAFRN